MLTTFAAPARYVQGQGATRLSDIGLRGVSDDDLRVVAERAVVPAETAHNEPFDVTPDLILDAIRAADACSRATWSSGWT
jgi:glycerol dehydrogenase